MSAHESGVDSHGKKYKDVEDLWREQFVDPSLAASSNPDVSSKKIEWYQKGADYWMSQDASVDGVLGGFGHISPVDLSGSKSFLQKLPGIQYGRAIDCGAGIGRISKGLLCPLFQHVDLVEQNPVYVDKAKEYCAGLKSMKEYYVQGLQDFQFARHGYDVIWIQWVIGHLPDTDFLPFMERCVAGLKPGGYIVLKENNAKKGFVMDLDDQSLTRTDAQFRALFEKAKLKLVYVDLQKNFPSALFPVRMYALQPETHPTTETDATTATAPATEAK